MEVEKESPSITYEAFVGDLDEGDSFTASLVDVLVKVRNLGGRSHGHSQSGPNDRNWLSAGPDQTLLTVASSLKRPRRACARRPRLLMSTAEVRGHCAIERDAVFPSLHHDPTARSMIFCLILTAKRSTEPCSGTLEYWKEHA